MAITLNGITLPDLVMENEFSRSIGRGPDRQDPGRQDEYLGAGPFRGETSTWPAVMISD